MKNQDKAETERREEKNPSSMPRVCAYNMCGATSRSSGSGHHHWRGSIRSRFFLCLSFFPSMFITHK